MHGVRGGCSVSLACSVHRRCESLHRFPVLIVGPADSSISTGSKRTRRGKKCAGAILETFIGHVLTDDLPMFSLCTVTANKSFLGLFYLIKRKLLMYLHTLIF
jgi:hypothetical protein